MFRNLLFQSVRKYTSKPESESETPDVLKVAFLLGACGAGIGAPIGMFFGEYHKPDSWSNKFINAYMGCLTGMALGCVIGMTFPISIPAAFCALIKKTQHRDPPGRRGN